MSKRLIALNVIMVGVAVFLMVQLVRDLSYSRTLPPPRAPRAASPAATPPPHGAPASEPLAAYNVIPAKSLFSPTRGEGPAAAAPAVPLPPKPILHGLLVDGPRSVAYLEDPVTKRILAHRVGDTIAGGRLEQIAEDRVVIRRSDGQMDVFLNDPAKLPSAPVAPSGAPTPPTPGPTTPPARAPRPGPAPPAAVRIPRVLPGVGEQPQSAPQQ